MTDVMPETVRTGKNLELKARLADLNAARARMRDMGADLQGSERQVDRYFATPRGRLKLRESTHDGAHLIVYSRPDDTEARISDFHRLPVAEPEPLVAALTTMFGSTRMIEKEREVWWWQDVRIHLDRVERLGTFIEFEARLDRIGDESEAARRIEALRTQLAIEAADLVSASYGDMTDSPD